MKMRGRWLAAAGGAALTMSGVANAETESLREALVKTYGTNPTIMAQRAQVRSLDQDVSIARAAGRPQVTATGGLNQDVLSTNSQGSNGRDFSVGGDISLPIFAVLTDAQQAHVIEVLHQALRIEAAA